MSVSKTTIIAAYFIILTYHRTWAHDGILEEEGRIVGGDVAKIETYPFIVSLRIQDRHICGGSIIHDHWILTAAHCIITSDPAMYTVVMGITHLNDTERQVHQVKKVIPHEGFSTFIYFRNDIALVELVEPITTSSTVGKVVLESEEIESKEELTLIGWGKTSHPGVPSNDLLSIELKSLAMLECRIRLLPTPIPKENVCTLEKRGEGACHGDSGGPLVRKKNGRQVGVVSWGRPCARGYPDVFTKVAGHKEWIRKNSGVDV